MERDWERDRVAIDSRHDKMLENGAKGAYINLSNPIAAYAVECVGGLGQPALF